MPIQVFLNRIEASSAGGHSQGDGRNQEPSLRLGTSQEPSHGSGTSQDHKLKHDDGSSQGDVHSLDVADTSDGGSQNVEHGKGQAHSAKRKGKKQCPKL